jgi:hypothetical protein
MRTTKPLVIALALAFAVSAQANAASMVAGWDFSQYFSDGLLSIDGATFTNTLSANYSDEDPNGLGTESAAFGTLLMDGTNGSHSTPLDGSDPFVPISPSLISNADAPGIAPPFGSGAAHNILCTSEASQAFCSDLAMIANDAVAMPVFQADVSPTGLPAAEDWVLSLGARTFSGTATVGVEVSLDGSAYDLVDTLSLTDVDTAYNVPLGAALDGASEVFVRLGFDPASGNPMIDNVAISAQIIPEPGTALLTLAGMVGLAAMGRRRA